MKRPSPTLSRSTMPRQEMSKRDFQVLPLNMSSNAKSFSPNYLSHASFPASFYSPLMQRPRLHPVHSTASQSVAFPVNFGHHPLAMQPRSQHNMFIPPMPHGIPERQLEGSPAAPMATGIDSSFFSWFKEIQHVKDQDILRDELNLRFLASHAYSSFLGSLPPPSLLWADIQQYMNQYQDIDQHHDMDECTYLGGMTPLAVQPTFISNLSPVLASSNPITSLPSGYPAPIPDVLHCGLTGAFQPTSLAGLHGVVNPLYMTGCEKLPTGHLATMAPPTAKPTTAKKPGKWCAVHKRIAWRIYNHQQNLITHKWSNPKTLKSFRSPSCVLSDGTKGATHRPDQYFMFGIVRERRLLGSDRHQLSTFDNCRPDTVGHVQSDWLAKYRSRSQSRSPLRNGRVDC